MTIENTAKSVRQAAADLAVLSEYDLRRQAKGHDYGAGQRAGELMRRRRELEDAARRGAVNTAGAALAVAVPGIRYGYPELEDFTTAEVNAAITRLLRPRLRRIEREDYRRSTPATRRTLDVLRAMLRDVERDLDRIGGDRKREASPVAGGSPELDELRLDVDRYSRRRPVSSSIGHSRTPHQTGGP